MRGADASFPYAVPPRTLPVAAAAPLRRYLFSRQRFHARAPF